MISPLFGRDAPFPHFVVDCHDCCSHDHQGNDDGGPDADVEDPGVGEHVQGGGGGDGVGHHEGQGALDDVNGEVDHLGIKGVF